MLTAEKLISVLKVLPPDTLITFGKECFFIKEVQVNLYSKETSVTLNPRQEIYK